MALDADPDATTTDRQVMTVRMASRDWAWLVGSLMSGFVLVMGVAVKTAWSLSHIQATITHELVGINTRLERLTTEYDRRIERVESHVYTPQAPAPRR